MAHLISPIDLAGEKRCCSPATKRTEAVLTGAATEIGPSEWEVFRAVAGGDPESNFDAESADVVEGSVKFGICCASVVQLQLTGRVETLNPGFDGIEVLLNGQQQFQFESTESSDDPWQTADAGPFTVTIPLSDRPCGNIVEIRGSTGDQIANNDVWWRAKILSIG